MWKKLLVPHDFSPCAARALGLAVDLARVHGAELVLVHVSELPANLVPEALVIPPGTDTAVRVDDPTLRGAREQLELIAEPLRREGIAVRTLAMIGEIAREILTAAKTVGADVLVVGTHGRTGLSHLFLGSVAEKLVRYASFPVVTVRSQAPEATLTREESTAQDELAG